MDESCVFLVNLHQLLVSFVPHARLWVCSHGNEVGYTLHKAPSRFMLRIYFPEFIHLVQVFVNESRMLEFT